MSVSSAGLRSAQVGPGGRSEPANVEVGWMLVSRHTQQPRFAEIDARMDDLRVIRATLVSIMEVGCDDLMVCATTRDCPLPFTEIARVSAAT